jgi:hypothetical protein
VSTPRERLAAILANVTSSKVKFTAYHHPDGRLYLMPNKVADFEIVPSDDKLQTALLQCLNEVFDYATGGYEIKTTVEDLLTTIKNNVVVEYEKYSERCAATKRKTQLWIQSLELDYAPHKHLVNFVFASHIEILSDGWDSKTRAEKNTYFETFESLRRVYGQK